MRLFLRLVLAVVLAACSSGRTDSSDADVAEGTVPGPGGVLGVCCPPGIPSCNCTPEGGWAPSMADCDTFGTCDARLWTHGTDEWGCSIIIPNSDFTNPENNCLMPVDAGAPEGPSALGEACTVVRGCREADLTCLEPTDLVLGGPADPIDEHPDGEESVVRHQVAPEGLCTYSIPEVTSETCDPADPDDPLCRDFGRCADLLGDSSAGLCVPTCVSDDECREGYVCDVELGGCRAGCSSDDWCRVARQETNGIEGLQSAAHCTTFPAACTPLDCSDAEPTDPDACADPAANFDRLVYDTESTATCDPESLRCTD